MEAGRGGADYRDFDYERINMYACMRAFAEVGYDGIIKPDHTPYLQDDSEDTRISWAFAIGQILVLRNALESGDPENRGLVAIQVRGAANCPPPEDACRIKRGVKLSATFSRLSRSSRPRPGSRFPPFLPNFSVGLSLRSEELRGYNTD